MNRTITHPNEPMLADAFAAFTAAAGWLQYSYQQLQQEVGLLREELQERNAALSRSLAENEAMRLSLSRILEALPCGVVVLEEEGSITFVNPETQRLMGTGDDDQRTNEAAQKMLARLHESEAAEQELCLEVENGKRWLAVRSAGLEGMASGAAAKQRVLIIRDITTQREMEREREEARRLIALAEMSSILAHEIRNPLGSMELFTGLLTESENLNDEQRGWAEHLQHGVRSLSATVNNVLQVHSSGAASRTPVMLAPILREAKSFLAPLAERADVAFSLAEQLSDAKIEGNAGELQQLIVNLALNAFQHTAAGGRTMLKATRQAGMSGEVARIELSDTGCGIPTPYLERIFEAGFTTRERSPGLGLAVCRSIVRQHRGLMTVHSQLGKGTTFRMEFPLL